MAFTLQTWQEKFKASLANWKQRMLANGVDSIYAFLASSALLPVAQAIRDGDRAMLLAIGGVLASVGANLIANRIEAWKSEAEIARELEAALPEEPDLRVELDTILEKLDALPLARQALAEKEREWFAQTLHAELQRLGNWPRFEAVLIGPGAIAQGPGARAVYAQTYIETQINADQPAFDLAHLRESYLNRLFESARQLSLAGVDPKVANDPEAHLHLDAVYTALLTLTPEVHERMLRGDLTEKETRRQSALELLNRHPRLVLLGDPGSGKSTFVNFIALCLAGEALRRAEAGLTLLTAPLPDEEKDEPIETKKKSKPQAWDHGALLPVRVILRDFAARGLPSAGAKANASHLWQFLAAELETACLADYTAALKNELLQTGGLILLDGLDEVPEAEQRRGQIKDAISDFAATFKNCRFLLTSRTYAYQKQEWRLPGFTEAVLASFTPAQIRRFVERWYDHIGALRGWHAEKAQGNAELLKRAIFKNDRLQALAERPLLLTLMASLHAWRSGTLPEKREELYADTVDLLLEKWESPKIVRNEKGDPKILQPSLAEWLRVDRQKMRDLLNELAYQAHAAQPELVGTADVPEEKLVAGLLHLSNNPEVKQKLLMEYLRDRTGLLLPRGSGVHTFPHRTFQEYLAACYLTDHDFPDLLAQLVKNDPNRWREATLLAGAKASRGAASTIWSLVDALCYDLPNAASTGKEFWGAHLAGQALAEIADLTRVSKRNQAKVQRVQQWLISILKHTDFPAVERSHAGNSLARLGDPRFRADAWFLPDEPLLGFVEISAGEFLMGSDKKKDKDAFDDEYPQHKVTLPAFYIARYPVTVAQFQAFVEDNKHQPKDPRCLSGLPNHPVVYVTWHEAMAYCDWLTEKLRTWPETPSPLTTLLQKQNGRIILPSEAEWEKAARGTKGLIYPWGDKPNPNVANYNVTGIGATSSVGCFPAGVSPSDCWDMSGNVWEWTRSLWEKYPYPNEKGGRQKRERLNAPEIL